MLQVAILEFCWNSRKNAMNDRQSLCSEMAEELRFFFRKKFFEKAYNKLTKVCNALSRKQTEARTQTELLSMLAGGESSRILSKSFFYIHFQGTYVPALENFNAAPMGTNGDKV